jgi:thymidylate synthase
MLLNACAVNYDGKENRAPNDCGNFGKENSENVYAPSTVPRKPANVTGSEPSVDTGEEGGKFAPNYPLSRLFLRGSGGSPPYSIRSPNGVLGGFRLTLRKERIYMEITARNVNAAVDEGFHWLALAGRGELSRNGPVLVAPEPVLTTYLRPRERVLFSPLRDANPFFHFFEALWMIAGRNDVEWPCYFNKQFAQFSDDGKTFWGAYGYRWREWFLYDQLALVVEELRQYPESRRAVLAMWDAGGKPVNSDLETALDGGKDVPCNTHAYFDLRGGVLNMTVCCRSNDMLWGGYGANAVHFSVLLEYLAAWLGVPVGVMRQFSNNYHVYPGAFGADKFLAEESAQERIRQLAVDAGIHDYYLHGGVRPFALVNTDIQTWDFDLRVFLEAPARDIHYKEVFFEAVARPMYKAWQTRKEKRGDGLLWARLIGAEDWRRACVEWIVRREAKKVGTK